MMKLEMSWQHELRDELALPYIAKLEEFLCGERQKNIEVYPPEPLIFNAFQQTPFSSVKVVIIGQDPYHGPGQAHGLCFSVPSGVPVPPSLRNIYLEMEKDLGIPSSKSGALNSWCSQGVLLLNSTLTVRSAQPKSHYGKGWEQFTDAVVGCLIQREDPVVFLLWGRSAKEKLETILKNKRTPHAVLAAAHPSPLSAYNGFFGCRHFSQANALLEKWGKAPINWNLEFSR